MRPAELVSPIFLGACPGAPFALGTLVRSTLASAGALHVRLGFAFISEMGLDLLVDALEHEREWEHSQKSWIIGLHHGISEPKAIERVMSIANSDVRVFVGSARLTREALHSGQFFHAKTIWVEGDDSRGLLLVASSANLTGSALGDHSSNYEAGILLREDAISSALATGFSRWWDQVWSESVVATNDLLGKYTSLRSEFLRMNPALLDNLDPPSPRRVNLASRFWIEAGAMSGGSRNQVEFNRELAAFFGPVSRSSRMLRN
jgi:HKD family nuclease